MTASIILGGSSFYELVVRAQEAKLIRETGANNPAIGSNIWPRQSSTSST